MDDLAINAHRLMVTETPTDKAKLGKEGDEEIIGEFYRVRDEGWWKLRLWLENEEAMLPPETLEPKGLGDQLCAATYGKFPNSDAIKISSNDVMKDAVGRSCDEANSLMFTFCPLPKQSQGYEMSSDDYIND